jgi:hypothetical protein
LAGGFWARDLLCIFSGGAGNRGLSKRRNYLLVDISLSRLKRRDILSHLLLFACDLLHGTPNDP